MQTLFSTDGLNPRDRFNRWQETLLELGVPLEQKLPGDGPFDTKLEAAKVGSLLLTRFSQSPASGAITKDLIQRNGKDSMVSVIFRLTGSSVAHQEDREAVQRPGDFHVLDNRPSAWTSSVASQSMFLELPRERLESVLGSARHYTALTVGAELGSTRLVSTFFRDLIQVRHRLDADAAERMSAIGIDLIVASIAGRLALEVSRPMQGTVVVQRAKAYIEANLGDTALDPPMLAAAVGVSLRRLQELFHQRGQHISDWIWHRRLEAATKRLTDPGCAHMQIGAVAFGCGFANQAHFSRRFKERHSMTPREYRQAALLGAV